MGDLGLLRYPEILGTDTETGGFTLAKPVIGHQLDADGVV